MKLDGRNTIWGIRDRTVKNLEFLNSAHVMGADVHVVTSLINSLLGLIVFPYQEISEKKYTNFKKHNLKELAKDGWPSWSFGEGSWCNNLDELIRHLRHAVAHRRVEFSSDARELRQVDVRFFDRNSDREAIINAAELHKFIIFFAQFLKQWQKDYS